MSFSLSVIFCCSFAKSCLTLCDPMDCSTPGSSVLHYLPELAQIYVHWVSDAIKPSYPLSPPSPPALSLSQHQDLFQRISFLCCWPKYWSFSINPCNEFSGLISFRIDWFDLLAIQGVESSPAPQFESISSLVPSLFYGPTLISIHDCWRNHSFDYPDLCGQIFFSKISEYLNQIQCLFCWGIQDLSSLTRDQTCTSCIGRRSLNHWDTRELHLLLTL